MKINFQISIILATLLFANEYKGPDDNAGDPSAIRESWMDGNNVYLYFKNTSQLSNWAQGGLDNVSRWPNDLTGSRMVDGIGLLVGAKVYIEDDENPETLDKTIIDDLNQIEDETIKKHEIYFLQTHYREEMDQNTLKTLDWGFFPVFGYFNSYQDYPAMSDDPNTWPSTWPHLEEPDYRKGAWDGRFGEGVIKADLETYFVINDAQDHEYLQGDNFHYYPRGEEKKIQEDASAQAGLSWGGLGIRVETRGFQWNNPLARDALFWEYNIANISNYDINEVAFGYWVDNAIGGEDNPGQGDDEVGYFDIDLDLAYSWDYDGLGDNDDFAPGIMGFAYLESPGISDDGIDNDGDGLYDEKRNDGIDNDGDWVSSILSEDGTCSVLNDDLGVDGIPFTNDYGECNQQPDCDALTGLDCEPNFDSTDISESDMIGLTTFRLFKLDMDGKDSPDGLWFENDDIMFDLMTSGEFTQYAEIPDNLVEVFASGAFRLEKGQTERISMAELHSFDYLTLSPGGIQPNAPALFELKNTVQLIYETDYRFAQPPTQPTLTADAKDGKVILTWDSIAENSRDDFLPEEYQYDFEGYKLYKATDKYLKDPEVITDGYGNPMFSTPIFQCDKIDGITGFADWAPVSGTSYYLGDDSGIQHQYTDTDVINGRTYYYALVAYDYGLEASDDLALGIPPSENNTIIELDENEYILSTGSNVVAIQPAAPSAGYIDPDYTLDNDINFGTGTIDVNIYAPGQIEDNSTYYVTFINDELSGFQHNDGRTELIVASGVNVFKDTSEELDPRNLELIYSESSGLDSYNNPNYINQNIVESGADFSGNGFNDITYSTITTSESMITGVFDGLQLIINQTVEYPQLFAQDWKVKQNPNAQIFISPFPDIMHRQSLLSPLDVEIRFGENCDDSSVNTTGPFTNIIPTSPSNVFDENDISIPAGDLIIDATFDFCAYSPTTNEKLSLFVQDINNNDSYDKYIDKVLVGTIGDFLYTDPNNGNEYVFEDRWKHTIFTIDFNGIEPSQIPSNGDIYEVKFERPFSKDDTLKIITSAPPNIDYSRHDSDMENIKVVPNPYIGTNLLEESIYSSNFNQRRKIMFTHLPSECTIKIFTSSGVLVDVIYVNNTIDDGVAYWDLLNNQGLEVASGMYFFHVESLINGKEKIGKFAIVK